MAAARLSISRLRTCKSWRPAERQTPVISGLDVTTLDNLGAGSLLIGGVRSVDSNGETNIALVANSVELSNDANSPLEAPEVILVTGTPGSKGPPRSTASRGSARQRQRNPSHWHGRRRCVDAIKIGNDTKKISGDGSLLAVSNGGPLVIDRQNAGTGGLINILAGATIKGGNALTMDASGNLQIDKAAMFTAYQYFRWQPKRSLSGQCRRTKPALSSRIRQS